MGKVFGREPALFIGAIGVLISLGVAFGLKLSVEQIAAVNAAVLAVVAFATRSQVTPA